MDFNIETRKKQLDNLDQLISSSKSKVESILKFLEWKQEIVEKEDNLVQCPVNPHHRIHPKSWQEHIEKCLVKSEGYSLESQFLSEPPDDSKQSIFIDRNKKIDLITKELSEGSRLRLGWNGFDPDPQTSDRLTSTFSPDERLIFYNHAIENTVGPPAPPEFTTLHKKSDKLRPLTYQELLAKQRDAKRRRIKYRSVHVNRKNHTEVMREVIDGQMKEYKDWLIAKNECSYGLYDYKKDELERPHSSTSWYSSHSSSSRHAHRKNHKHRDYRDRSRRRHRSRSRGRNYRNEDGYSKISSGEERSCKKRRHADERRRSREKGRSRHGYYDERRH